MSSVSPPAPPYQPNVTPLGQEANVAVGRGLWFNEKEAFLAGSFGPGDPPLLDSPPPEEVDEIPEGDEENYTGEDPDAGNGEPLQASSLGESEEEKPAPKKRASPKKRSNKK